LFNSYLSITALIALGAGAPALATAAQAPAAKPAAQAQAAPTRASFIRSLDNGFKAIDTNGDGSLSSAELQVAEGKVQQQRLAAMRARVEKEFTKLDTNKDNQLSKAEFMAAAPSAPSNPPNGARVVAQLDKNKDGKISVDEYRAPRLSAFDKVDTNHDGTLSVAERQAATAAARNK
jgi:Ca2+-binding EF-hand superfamily protein